MANYVRTLCKHSWDRKEWRKQQTQTTKACYLFLHTVLLFKVFLYTTTTTQTTENLKKEE